MHTAAVHRRKAPASLFTTHLLVIPGHGRTVIPAPPRMRRVTPAQWLEAKRQS